jgi:hypothetical protein
MVSPVGFRTERLIGGCRWTTVAVPCYVMVWAFDGYKPVIPRFRDGVEVADVIGSLGAFGASLAGLTALGRFVWAALPEDSELSGD